VRADLRGDGVADVLVECAQRGTPERQFVSTPRCARR
jgi:hypothetical protein